MTVRVAPECLQSANNPSACRAIQECLPCLPQLVRKGRITQNSPKYESQSDSNLVQVRCLRVLGCPFALLRAAKPKDHSADHESCHGYSTNDDACKDAFAEAVVGNNAGIIIGISTTRPECTGTVRARLVEDLAVASIGDERSVRRTPQSS
eukprot:scaffold1486_cov332-Pinguiococcus_pyrenoidosus.AAC.3